MPLIDITTGLAGILERARQGAEDAVADDVIEQLEDLGLLEAVRRRLADGTAPAKSNGRRAAPPKARAAAAKKKTASPVRAARTAAPATCSVKGCGRELAAKGLCMTHYKRKKRGQPLDTPIGGVGGGRKGKTPKADDESEPVETPELVAHRSLPRKRRRGSSVHLPASTLAELDREDAEAAAKLGELEAGQRAGTLGRPLQLVDHDAPHRRRVNCPAYNACLAYAVKQKWQSFTCDGCTGPGLQPDQIRSIQKQAALS